MRDAPLPEGRSREEGSFLACVATVAEVPVESLPGPDRVHRWLGGLGLGLAPVAEPRTFSWPGPWIARLADGRSVVMFGVPSGVVWDPAGGEAAEVVEGFLVAATDVALALPPRPDAPATAGTVEAIYVAPAAGEPVQALASVRALAGRGLDGDRHVLGTGTFPSGTPGSALTLIAAEVCESFAPPLEPSVHRRNVVTRGIDLNALVGREFAIGGVPCRGMRLGEPCRVLDGYAGRPVLRALVHRGGLRADVLADGELRVGDAVVPT